MFEYNAKDGLNILKHLGLQDLTQEEEKIFKERWKEAYRNLKDPISATRVLYANILPFVCHDEYDEQIMTSNTRNYNFDEKVRECGLAARLEQGISLGSALKSVPARV